MEDEQGNLSMVKRKLLFEVSDSYICKKVKETIKTSFSVMKQHSGFREDSRRMDN